MLGAFFDFWIVLHLRWCLVRRISHDVASLKVVRKNLATRLSFKALSLIANAKIKRKNELS
jgi:hypothetical protein